MYVAVHTLYYNSHYGQYYIGRYRFQRSAKQCGTCGTMPWQRV